MKFAGLALAALATALSAGQLSASTLSPEGKRHLRLLEQRERASADVVVVGRWAGPDAARVCAGGHCEGTINAVRIERGAQMATFAISYESYLDFIRGTNAPPDIGVCAKFYLKRNDDSSPATYAIIQFQEFNEKARKCSKKS